MSLRGLLQPAQIKLDAVAASKKKILELAAHLLAEAAHQPIDELIYASLLNREKMGSSGMEYGIAIPHVRMDMIHQPVGAFIRLQKPVLFDSLDDQAVDIVFAIAVPSADDQKHLNILSELAHLFSQDEFRQSLRSAQTAEQVHALFYPKDQD